MLLSSKQQKKYVHCCKQIRIQKMLLLEKLVFVAPRKDFLCQAKCCKREIDLCKEVHIISSLVSPFVLSSS